jgi:snapalysin
MIRRTVITLLAFVLALVGGTVVTAPAASADVGVAAVTITYSDAQAAEFVDAVAEGVAIWNASVSNVQIERAAPGTRADVQVIADNGWPRATLGPVRPGGSGTVWMGRQAVDQGYAVVRIASHEFGHILGLPDLKPGPCSSLMSGSSAGVSCTNPNPDAEERAWVESNYSNALTGSGRVVVD